MKFSGIEAAELTIADVMARQERVVRGPLENAGRAARFSAAWLPALALGLSLAAGPGIRAEDKAKDWPWTPIARPAVPKVERTEWVRTPIDAFILHSLERFELEPAKPADRATLIRRVTFDLTGLPPSPEEVRAFLADDRPDAYERVVDRLLASPEFGERWGRHWLDVVRYADSDGFEYDDPRPHAWRYRDWVIDAFNADMPYDRFVREQIAGDELYPDEPSARVAVGLHRLGPLRLNAGNQDEEKNRQEVLTEMTDVVGSAFMGLTIGCARCHDHKFDPIPQADYFGLQAIFAGTTAKDEPIVPEAEVRDYEQRLGEWKKRSARLRKQLGKVGTTGSAKEGEVRSQLEQQLMDLEAAKPEPPPSMMTVIETASEAPPTFILKRGEPGQRLNQVEPHFLSVLDQVVGALSPSSSENQGTRGRRAALAQWLTDSTQPLTARVIVNRLWHHHFGRGLVSTTNNFGVMGEPPAHPELLDWLASELASSGYRLKDLHRLMVTSATYMQGTEASAKSLEEDSENALLSHMPRRRLEAEAVRDAVLATSGLLNRQRGGPGVRLPLDPEVASQVYKGAWEPTPEVDQHTRRTVYLFTKRNIANPMLESFDAPDTMSSCGARTSSIHAAQALALLNSPFLDDGAQAFARRVLEEAGPGPEAVAQRALDLALGRPSRPGELEKTVAFLERQTARLRQEGVGWDAADGPVPTGVDPAFAVAVSDLCLALFNLDEFLYVD